MIGRLLRDLLTGTSNRHFELGRLAWALTVLAGILYQGLALAVGGEFNLTDFGTGMGIILAAGGAGVAAKDLAHPGNRLPRVLPDAAPGLEEER